MFSNSHFLYEFCSFTENPSSIRSNLRMPTVKIVHFDRQLIIIHLNTPIILSSILWQSADHCVLLARLLDRL
jgi:hypothetical protein